MKVFDSNEFSNLTSDISLTSTEVFDIIKQYKLNFISARNKTVEWDMYLPMFVPSFYEFILRENNIPTQLEYYQNYLNINNDFFSEQKFNEELMVGIKARLFRTYPSLVRDIHFAKYLSEKFTYSSIIYNQFLDIKEGIDLMIINNDKNYAINLFTETNRAQQSRQKKTFRHTDYSNVKYIEIPVAFNGSVKCGDFFLYGEREKETILSELKKNR